MINETIERLSSEIVQGFRNLLRHDSITCAISDCMGRFNAMTSDMKPLFEGIRLVGTAVTVRTLASDLAAAFKAIDICKPGDVVVIDSHGSINTAFWGENMTMSAINRGVIAAVIDGACRDVEEIRKIRFPVRMLAILSTQQFAHLRAQSGMPALVRTDLAAQRLHGILLLITGSIEPPLDRSTDQIEPVAR